MRFFGLIDEPISVDKVAGWLQKAMIDCEIESEEGEGEDNFPGCWSTLTLFLDDGEPVIEIEKYGFEEENFTAAIQDTVRLLLDDKKPVKPASAVKWLCQFMSKVKVLYEFRPMPAVKTEAGWELFNEVWTNMRDILRGIVHLEDEGFTNEQGAQITWEYPDADDVDASAGSDAALHGTIAQAAGDAMTEEKLKVAVLDQNGQDWIEYMINLANQEQRLLFMAGKAPDKLL
ncbi:MAG: hypothetical protein KGS72_10625 [Cyanobacteria bacterium REEB67]|nr:hypothetical protein [Cyanobacteria bacterium REEB67]